jgi:serine/threonine-protein kinase
LVAATSEPPTSVKDNVVSINPAEGAEVAQNTQITVTFATGQSAFPDLSGFAQAAAVQAAKAAGFANVTVKERAPTAAESQNGTPAAGTVIETDPKAGTVADRTTPVTIFIATAPSSPPTPSSTPTAAPSS